MSQNKNVASLELSNYFDLIYIAVDLLRLNLDKKIAETEAPLRHVALMDIRRCEKVLELIDQIRKN